MITAQQLAAGLRAFAAAVEENAQALGTLTGGAPSAVIVPQQSSINAPATVTADELTALIMPHISNAAIKEALGVAMRANGVANLPEAQPHQFGALYAAFQQVLTQHGVGGPAPVAAVSASII